MEWLTTSWYADEPLAVVGAWIFLFFWLQYLLFAAGAYLICWVWGRDRFAARRIQGLGATRGARARPGRELLLSTMSIGIFSLLLTVLVELHRWGWVDVYSTVADFGWLAASGGWDYWLVSLALMAVVHDSYYYFAHRWMHHPRVFRQVHKVHHEFSNPTPFASFAFHPYEAVVEVAWFLPLALLLPLHPGAMAAYILILTWLNVVSHLGYEFYPTSVARWFITSSHHNMHHSHSRGHFMLYFNGWDRILGTNMPDYEYRMAQLVERARLAVQQQPDRQVRASGG